MITLDTEISEHGNSQNVLMYQKMLPAKDALFAGKSNSFNVWPHVLGMEIKIIGI